MHLISKLTRVLFDILCGMSAPPFKGRDQACALYGVRYGTLCTVRTVIL